MRQVLLAINILKGYNQKMHDDRFTAIIDILESIVRDEARALVPLEGSLNKIQKDLLRAAMDNMGVTSINFEGGPPIFRKDLEDQINDEEERNS